MAVQLPAGAHVEVKLSKPQLEANVVSVEVRQGPWDDTHSLEHRAVPTAATMATDKATRYRERVEVTTIA